MLSITSSQKQLVMYRTHYPDIDIKKRFGSRFKKKIRFRPNLDFKKGSVSADSDLVSKQEHTKKYFSKTNPG